MSPQQDLRYVPLPRDWPLDRNLVPKEVAFPWLRACCRTATPCSPSGHCGRAQGSAGPYVYREASQLARVGSSESEWPEHQCKGRTCPSHMAFCVSFSAFWCPSIPCQSEAILHWGGRLGGCSAIAAFCISSDICSVPLSWFPSNPARTPTVIPAARWVQSPGCPGSML